MKLQIWRFKDVNKSVKGFLWKYSKGWTNLMKKNLNSSVSTIFGNSLIEQYSNAVHMVIVSFTLRLKIC